MRNQPEYEKIKHLIERIVSIRTRARRHFREAPRRRARAEAIATVTKTLGQAKDSGAENIRRVLNTALYALLFEQELVDFGDDLGNAIGDRRRRFVAKHLAMLLYEASEDFTQLLGKEFREALGVLSPPTAIVRQFNRVASDLNQSWREHREFLGRIRNAVAAHRDHDALAYLRVLDAIEPLEVMRRAASLSEPLRGLTGVLAEILQASVTPSAIAADILRGTSARPTP